MKALSITNWAAVLFDFDGVLVDSMPVHVEAWNRASADVLGSELDGEMKKEIVGQSTIAIAAHIVQNFGSSAQRELIEAKHDRLNSLMSEVDAFPGAKDFMELLKQAGVPYGIASNAPSQFVTGTARKIGFDVEVVLGRDHVSHPKPAPDLYLLCAKRLSISVTDHPRVVVFEDSLHGLRAAAKAKMIPYGIASHHDPKDLVQAGAQEVFTDFNDVIQCIA